MESWKKILVTPDDTLESVTNLLEQEARRIVLVVNHKMQLLGTITDGDVRRALIKGNDLKTKAKDVMCSEPYVAHQKESAEKRNNIIKSNVLLHLPVLDDDGVLVGLESVLGNPEESNRKNPVFLMAGGFGKRLQPLTNDLPKPLLNIGSKPVLEIILEQFVEEGFCNFIISTHYKAEMIRDYFGDGEKWNVDISYVHEDSPLGTAGALGLLPRYSPDLPIIMMNGDLLTKVSFQHLLDFHNEQGGLATMCVREYDFCVPYGVVQIQENRVSKIQEKPVHKFFVNAGIYVIDNELLQSVPKGAVIDMPDLLGTQVDNGKQVNIFPIHEYWLDIGRMEEFERAQNDIGSIF